MASPISTNAHNDALRVCLLVGSLEFGGAERQVVEMVRSFDRKKIRPIICSLSREVPLAANLPNRAEELVVIQKHHRFDVTAVVRVSRFLRRQNIQVVHAFLFDAEIVSRLASPLAGVRRVVSSERNTDYVRPLIHRIAYRLTQNLFDVMVANSHSGKRFNMRTLGIPESRIEVVHNGVDTERFKPDPAARARFREAQGIPSEALVVGMVASYKPQKAHDVFMKMAARVAAAHPNARFLIVGEPLRDNFESTSRIQNMARQMAKDFNILDRCLFIGNQKEVQSVYNACDITTLLSRHEGTPNVVLESMACGIPVVVTDIADNAVIVAEGRTGYVVPKDDSDLASERVKYLLGNTEARKSMSAAARERACDEFSLKSAAGKLTRIYTEGIGKTR